MSKLDSSPHDYTSLVPGKGKFPQKGDYKRSRAPPLHRPLY